MTKYKATISKNKGKDALSIIFRHPVKTDPKTNYGIRVRRGLGTSNEDEAQKIVDQMNEILSDPMMWSIDKKQLAQDKYSKIVVDAFYDFLESEVFDHNQILNDVLPFPTRKDGYGKAIFMGHTGAGKTSVLRCIMGTQKHKFPTTATGRTTTCTMEVILSDSGEYELVVTFMTRELLMLYVKECVQNAVMFCVEKQNNVLNADIAEKLLTHKELTVRLSYILGHPSMLEQGDDEFADEDEEIIDEGEETSVELDQQEIEEFVDKINENLDSIKLISKEFLESRADQDSFNEEDEEISLEMFLEKSDKYNDIIDDIVEDIQQKFSILTEGTVISENRGWINAWHFKTTDSDKFINVAKRFSSNNKSQWGTLLTPIVQFVRIKGNFKPPFAEETPKLVLVDGLGLGHKTTSTSIPTEITSRFQEIDSIILVDNATSPVMDNAKVAIKTIVESGNTNKLLTCFTHMDELVGDNLRTGKDKVTHVKSSLDGYLTALKEQVPPIITESAKTDILDSCFYMWNIDKDIKGPTQKQFEKLFTEIASLASKNTRKEEVELHYDVVWLYSCIQEATKVFRSNWKQILGVPYKTSKTEHWTRIKALSRRLYEYGIDHYNYELMPIADLLSAITSQLNIFLSEPLQCFPEDAPDEVKEEVINSIKSCIYDRMHLFARNSIWKNTVPMTKWKTAYLYRDTGSASLRAYEIDEIFDIGVPILNNYSPNMRMKQEEKALIEGVIAIAKSAIEKEGGKLSAFSYSIN